MIVAWSYAASAVTAAFLVSLVEAVEAATIVLAAVAPRRWLPAGLGAMAGLILLGTIIAALGSTLGYIPVRILRRSLGLLLLLFGMRWLRRSILCSAKVALLPDQVRVYTAERAELIAEAERGKTPLDWLASLPSFQVVLLEGLEVAFVVIAVGARRDALLPASLGAIAACVMVASLAWPLRRALARMPENTLRFVVGALLSAFGVYQTGEGLSVTWPGGDFAIIAIAGMFLTTGVAAAILVRRQSKGAQS